MCSCCFHAVSPYRVVAVLRTYPHIQNSCDRQRVRYNASAPSLVHTAHACIAHSQTPLLQVLAAYFIPDARSHDATRSLETLGTLAFEL